MDMTRYLKIDGEKPLDNIVSNGGYCSILRRIVCIGDSLSSGEFESCRNGKVGYHDSYDYSWGQYIARACGSKVYNFSRGGMTAEVFMNAFAEQCGVWSREKLCQAYIIALGVNDIIYQNRELGSIDDICMDDYEKNSHNFAGYYAQIIQ